ncbi:extracellular solute-binding protein [Clostridium sp. MCC353]|uniref:ABC transporter substrate-binding protein n=1 Tax=Clostridium sp. MCC353 TaxID=2592646 RepID=UPI001C00EC76|nr:extracellular solute-binding protein [Clostridium sp. MCC353]
MGKHEFFRAAALAAAVCLCGCTKPEIKNMENTSAPVYEWGTVTGRTITVWGREDDLTRSYISRAFRRYEEMTGNAVEIKAFSPDQVEERVSEAIMDKESGMDVLLYFGGVNIDAFDPDANFYDFSEAPWVEDLTDTAVNQAIYHGKVIGLPHWEASVSGTLYNKKLFKRYGITPPETQEQFWQTCETLLQNGITPLYLPCGSPTMLLYQFPLDTIVKQNGVLEEINRGTLDYADLPEMKTVADWYRRMAKNGYLGEGFMENDWAGMSPAMESGEYAMMLCWDTWLYTDFEGDPSDFGLMPAFVGVPEKGTFEGPNLSLFMVNRHGAQVEAALDLISFMADPYNYNDAFEGIYTAPVFKGQKASISTPQYVEAARWIEENYNDSIAWLNIKGFSQWDAVCIRDYMSSDEDVTAEECLRDMDELRRKRASLSP